MIILKTSKDALLKPLQTVVGVVERKHTLPILSNILFEFDAEKIACVATDLEIQITTWLAEKSDSKTDVTVSARKLLDICRSLPDDTKVEIELVNDQIKLKAGKSKFNLQTLPAINFPKLQIGEDEGYKFSISQSKFKHLLSRVQYAMAVQDIRYYLNGMLLSLLGNKLTVAATDGHRLALDSIDLEEPCAGSDVILPRKMIIELIKLLKDSEDKIEIQIGSNQIVVRSDDFELRSKIIDGKFPDYQRVIPPTYDKIFDIGRQKLQQALSRAAILTNDKYRGVRFAMTSGTLRVACSNNEQEEAQEEIEIDYNFDPLDIGFNVQYVQDVLNNLECETVRCSFGDPTSSMLITVPGEQNFRYVVMPMRI